MDKNNLETKKSILESQIESIKLQLLENKKNIDLANKGLNVVVKDNVWCIKARQALLIKKGQLKKINKQLFNNGGKQ